MGLQDRSYYQDEYRPAMATTMVVRLIIVTVVVYLIDAVVTQRVEGQLVHPVSDWLALRSDWFSRPWTFFQLLTYGFFHQSLEEPGGLTHILFNMLFLYMAGRMLESEIGAREFLAFYLAAIVFAGLAWSGVAAISGDRGVCVGASGATAATLAAISLKFPHQRIALFGMFEMPLWAFGLLSLVMNLMGTLGVGESNVAYTAHLGGAAFGAIYVLRQWRITDWLPGAATGSRSSSRFSLWRRRPKLGIVRDDASSEDRDAQEEDRILAKISDQGIDSLTAKERRFMAKRAEQVRKKKLGK